jgi:hypothetical protein
MCDRRVFEDAASPLDGVEAGGFRGGEAEVLGAIKYLVKV